MYQSLPGKSWRRILAENRFPWQPPLTVHLPIQPVHSPHTVFIDCALNASVRRVAPGLSVTDIVSGTRDMDTLAVHFAFDDPPFVPDYRYGTLALDEGRYPLAHAEYFSSGRDLLYAFDYYCCPLDGSRQSLLWIAGSVANTGAVPRPASVRVKVNVQREVELFDYHYIPFSWDAGRWKPCPKMALDGDRIRYDGHVIGKLAADEFAAEWKPEETFQPEDYHYRNLWEGYYSHPFQRFTAIQDVIHLQSELARGERKGFHLALLTNYGEATEADAQALRIAEAHSCRTQARAHFQSLLPADTCTRLIFPQDRWEEMFTELQLTALQLLVQFPGQPWLTPLQGGSSERHFVWVWEAMVMLLPLLPLGHFAPVKQALAFIFSLQDGGFPPQGKFTTTAGAIGTTGPRWANTTGAALTLAGAYCLYSRDQAFLDDYLPKMLRAADWIVGEIRATRQPRPDGTRPPTYGLMPLCHATDGDVGYVVAFTDAYTFQGLQRTAQLLERIGHPRAAEYRREVEQYRADILAAVATVTREDGYIDRAIETGEEGESLYRKFDNTCGAFHLAYCGVLDAAGETFQRYMNYFETRVADGYFLGQMDRDIFYTGVAEHAWQDIYLRAGEWKRAFMATQINLRYGMTQDTSQVQERFSKSNPAFTPWQPNGSGIGKVLDTLIKSLYFEVDGAATLLGGVPFPWLQWNVRTALLGLHTVRGGQLSLDAEMLDATRCRVRLTADAPGVLPGTVRFPEHFCVQAVSELVCDAAGYFIIPTELQGVEFQLTEAPES
ncbi:MAG: hypothetical protein ACYC7E_11055 [Armatimonadota bacterium]